jgi:adenylate cyclase
LNDLLLSLPATEPDQQPVTVVFADVVGSTELAHQLPLCQFSALMAELLQVLFLHFDLHGSRVLQHHGDGVLGVWDGRRAADALNAATTAHGRAARLDLARQLGLSLQLHCGVASGEVCLTQVGSGLTPLGLPPILARRLCDAAGPGETLACQTSLHSAPQARVLAISERPLRGFPNGVRAVRVLEAATAGMKIG